MIENIYIYICLFLSLCEKLFNASCKLYENVYSYELFTLLRELCGWFIQAIGQAYQHATSEH